MAATVTLADLRQRVCYKCDLPNPATAPVGSDTFLSVAELDTYINTAIAEFHDILVTKAAEDYYLNSYDITTTGTDTYNLPADFYKLRGVDKVVGNTYYTLERFEFKTRNNYKNSNILNSTTNIYLYRLQNETLVLTPTPGSGETIRLWYTPCFTKLTSATDTLKGYDGLEEYVVNAAAMAARARERSDLYWLAQEKAALVKRVENMLDERNYGGSTHVVDIYGGDLYYNPCTGPYCRNCF